MEIKASPIQIPKHRNRVEYDILLKKIELLQKMLHYDKKIIDFQADKLMKLENTIRCLENVDNQHIISVLKHSGAFDGDLVEEINRKEDIILHKNKKITRLIEIIREKNIEIDCLNFINLI